MSLEPSVLILDFKAVDMYFANESSSIESMRLTATDWELLESIEGVLEACLSNTLFVYRANSITIVRLHTSFCKQCHLNQRQYCAVPSPVSNFS
jgi:hypothetical protein